MHYVVTGGAGFIGSNTVDELVRRGHQVRFDDLSTGKQENLAGVNDKINFVYGSITDLEATSAACGGADYVLHLAAMTSVPRSVKDPVATNRVNVDGIVNVLVAARDAGVRRVVFSSSSAIYGETPTLPKREDMPPAKSPIRTSDFRIICFSALGTMSLPPENAVAEHRPLLGT